MDVAQTSQARIAVPAIRMDLTARHDRRLNKPFERQGGGIRLAGHPNTPRPLPVFFGGDHHQRLVVRSPSALAFGQAPHVRFIDFHRARQGIPTWTNHRAAQFVQPTPGGSVTPQPQDTLQAQSAGPMLLTGHSPGCPEPQSQRRAGVLENGPGGGGHRIETPRTHLSSPSVSPRLAFLAPRTHETLRPLEPFEILAAGRVGCKPLIKLQLVFWIIFCHSSQHYRLGVLSSKA